MAWDDEAPKPEELANSKSDNSSWMNLPPSQQELAKQAEDTIRPATFAETSPIMQKLKAFGYGTNIPGSSEIAGLVGKLKGQDYKNAQNLYKANAELSQYQNPMEYGAGSLTGGAAMMAAPETKLVQGLPIIGSAAKAFSGLGNAAKGALMGGAQGAESSNVDMVGGKPLTSDSLQQLGKDIAIPAAIGGGAAAIPDVLAATVQKTPLRSTGFGKIFSKAYDEGLDLSNENVANLIGQKKVGLDTETANSILDKASSYFKKKADLVEKHGGNPVDVDQSRQVIEDALNSFDTNHPSTVAKIQKIRDNISKIYGDVPVEGDFDIGQLTNAPGKTTMIKQMGPRSLKDAETIRKDLSTEINAVPSMQEAFKGQTNPLESLLSKGRGVQSEAINASTPEIAEINPQIQKVNEAMRALKLPAVQDAGDLGNKLDLSKKISKYTSIASDASPEELARHGANVGSLTSALADIDPEILNKFKQSLKYGEDLGTAGLAENDLGKLAYHGGRLRWAATQAAGKGGLYLGKIADTAPAVSSGISNLESSPSFEDMTDDQKIELAKQLRTQNNAGVAAKVEKATKSEDPIDHAQADFVLKQTGGLNQNK